MCGCPVFAFCHSTGGSAGGLSTFLHADRFAAALKGGAKDIKTIRAAPVVGYFLDHDNFAHTVCSILRTTISACANHLSTGDRTCISMLNN